MPLRVHGLTHVAIRVADLDRSLAFYQRLFGSEVRYRDETTIELRTPGRHDALTLELGEVPQRRSCAFGSAGQCGFGGAHRSVVFDRPVKSFTRLPTGGSKGTPGDGCRRKWGGRWDSNPRQPESQSGTLPLSYAHHREVACPTGFEPVTLSLEG